MLRKTVYDCRAQQAHVSDFNRSPEEETEHSNRLAALLEKLSRPKNEKTRIRALAGRVLDSSAREVLMEILTLLDE